MTSQVARDRLWLLGQCLGKFTHSGKFRLGIGSLDIMAQYAKYKVGDAARHLPLQGSEESHDISHLDRE